MQFPSEIRYSIGLFFMQSWVLKLGIKLPNKYRELSKLPIHIGHVLISFLDELAYFILTMKYTCVKLIIVFCHSCSLYSCFLPCPWGMLSVWSVLMPPNLSKGYVFMLMPPVSSIKYLCGLCWCLLPCPQGMLAVWSMLMPPVSSIGCLCGQCWCLNTFLCMSYSIITDVYAVYTAQVKLSNISTFSCCFHILVTFNTFSSYFETYDYL